MNDSVSVVCGRGSMQIAMEESGGGKRARCHWGRGDGYYCENYFNFHVLLSISSIFQLFTPLTFILLQRLEKNKKKTLGFEWSKKSWEI